MLYYIQDNLILAKPLNLCLCLFFKVNIKLFERTWLIVQEG